MLERQRWPILIRFILWGIPSRALALACWVVCVAGCVGGAVYSFWDARGLVGVPLLIGVVGYAWAIRWVDRNSRWQ